MGCRTFLVALILVAAPLSAAADEPKPADKPDPKELLKSIPVLTERDEKIDSIEAVMKLSGGWVVRAWYRKPDRCALSWSDSSGAPIMIVADGKVLVFDYVNRKVVSESGADKIRFSFLKDEEGKLQWKVNWVTKEAIKDGDPAFHLDIASFFRGYEDGLEAKTRGKSVVLSAEIDEQSEIRAELVPGEVFPCVRFEMGSRADEAVPLALGIRVNAPPAETPPVLPALEVLRKYVAVEEVDANESDLAFIKRAGETCLSLLTALKALDTSAEPAEVEKARAEAEKTFGRKIDWGAVKEFHDKVVEALREAAKPAPIFAGAEKLGMTPEQEAKAREWVEKQGAVLDAGKFADFLDTILDARQRDILREIMKSPVAP